MIENNVATVVAGTVYNQETSPSVDYKYGPYNSIQEALSILGPTDLNCICAALRFGVKQSNGTVKTYEFKTGVANESDLICITDELANKGITRVELECDDDTTIKIKGTTSSLTYDQVKDLVDDRTKFVTLRYLDIWWMLPSYDDGGAIMFTSTDITNGHAEVTRVVMNTDSQMSNYTIITEDADHKTDDLTKETALDGHQTYPTTHAVNQALSKLPGNSLPEATEEDINNIPLDDGIFYGVFPTEQSLPVASSRGYAYIGIQPPYKIYTYNTSWVDSGDTTALLPVKYLPDNHFIEVVENGFYIVDSEGNIGMSLTEEGLKAKNILNYF